MSARLIVCGRARAHSNWCVSNDAFAPSNMNFRCCYTSARFRRDVPEVKPPEGFMNLFMKNPCGEPILLRCKICASVKRNACKFLLVLFLFCTRKVRVLRQKEEKCIKSIVIFRKKWYNKPIRQKIKQKIYIRKEDLEPWQKSKYTV